jgi:hypothetical protein
MNERRKERNISPVLVILLFFLLFFCLPLSVWFAFRIHFDQPRLDFVLFVVLDIFFSFFFLSIFSDCNFLFFSFFVDLFPHLL